MPTEEAIVEALRSVKYPGYSRDIISFGLLKEIASNDQQKAVVVKLQLTSGTPAIAEQIKTACEAALRGFSDLRSIKIDVQVPAQAPVATPANPWSGQNRVSGLKRIVAVASGKGGVGKSTCSANLACAMQRMGSRVGLLDCDIYGPSIPLMMGASGKPTISDQERLVPLTAHGVKLMSMGFLLEGDSPVIWRGPMIQKTIQQFLTTVDWGDLDILLVDLPPGTGDAQLSLCQTVPLDGGVIITTPQEASLGVVRKGIAMFEKVNVPLLGIVENMSYFVTPKGERVEIFGHGGGRSEAERQNLPFLGEIPLFMEVRIGGDSGQPVAASAPDSAAAKPFYAIAKQVLEKLK